MHLLFIGFSTNFFLGIKKKKQRPPWFKTKCLVWWTNETSAVISEIFEKNGPVGFGFTLATGKPAYYK